MATRAMMSRIARVGLLGLLALVCPMAPGCGSRPTPAAPPPWPTPPPAAADDPRAVVIGEWVESGPPTWTTAARKAKRPAGGRHFRRRLIFTSDGAFEVLDHDRHLTALALYTAERAPGGLALTVYRSGAPDARPESLRLRIDGDTLEVEGDARTYVRAAPLDGRILAGTWFRGDLRAKLSEEGDWSKATPERQRALDGLLLGFGDMRVITPDLRTTDRYREQARLVVVDAHAAERCVSITRPGGVPGGRPEIGAVEILRREGDRLIDDDQIWVSAAYRTETLARLAAVGFEVSPLVPTTLPEPLRRSPWAEPPPAPVAPAAP